MTWTTMMDRALHAGLAVLLVTTVGCGDDGSDADTGAQAAPTPVRTTDVTVSQEPDRVRGSGRLAAQAEMNLAFKIPGYVEAILADEGDRVRSGQVLARLRSDEVDAQVRSAEAQAELASKNLERMQRLFADSVITEAMLEQAVDGNERAQAGLDAARFNQTYATIRAPAAGRVLRRMVEASEFMGAGVPAFRLGASTSGWVVRMGVADRHVVRLSIGDPAEVSLPALSGQPLSGTVSEIADAADPRSGTFEVEVRVDDDGGRLRSGMVAQVSITLSDVEELSFLPPQALIDTQGLDAAVFVVEGQTVRRHAVRVVRIGSETVGVYAPELEGATVVTDGAAYLREGERIEDRTADFAASSN